ncbi:MAG: ribosomal protein S18-alanine N-acetyltransferase [bacterium]
MPRSSRKMGEEKSRSSTDVVIEAMTVWDVDEIVAIEDSIFPAPWPVGAFTKSVGDSSSVCLVARTEGGLVGYAVAWLLRREMHIGNLAVDRPYWRKGIASKLLSRLLESAQERGFKTVTLEVRVSNAAAISLYRKFGFKEVAIRRNYYPDENEDAVVMLRQRT